MRRFTLLELLIVIAIILILLGIAIPVLNKGWEKGRQITCGSNLRQIGILFQTYCDDYDEYIPTIWGVNYSGVPYSLIRGGPTNKLVGLGILVTGENVEYFGCPSSDITPHYIKDKWLNTSGKMVVSAYIYRETFNNFKPRLCTNSKVSAILIDWETIPGYKSHQGKWVNALFSDGHIKGAANTNSQFSYPDSAISPTAETAIWNRADNID